MAVALLASRDQTVVSTALPTIVGDLGGVRHLHLFLELDLLHQPARRSRCARGEAWLLGRLATRPTCTRRRSRSPAASRG
jgi:hypothetical protein